MKKTILAMVAFGLFQITYAQYANSFDNLISTQGYDRTIEFDMNSNPSVRGYRFISRIGNTLQIQSNNRGVWKTTMTINNNRVGIGTSGPAGLLDVNGVSFSNQMILDGLGPDGYQLQIGPKVPTGDPADRVMNFLVSGTYSGFDFFDTNGELRLDYDVNNTYSNFGMKDENGQEIFKFANQDLTGTYLHLPQTDSRIVIGGFGSYLSGNGYKLVVKDGDAIVQGTMVAEEVIVSLSIPPDYVFEKYYEGASKLKEDYTMPSLEEVAAYTKENHHLPNVPSANTIQQEGLSVAEMSGLLLQKIEELTLYTIEQEDRIKRLEKQLEELD